jgi:hypothetical protein
VTPSHRAIQHQKHHHHVHGDSTTSPQPRLLPPPRWYVFPPGSLRVSQLPPCILTADADNSQGRVIRYAHRSKPSTPNTPTGTRERAVAPSSLPTRGMPTAVCRSSTHQSRLRKTPARFRSLDYVRSSARDTHPLTIAGRATWIHPRHREGDHPRLGPRRAAGQGGLPQPVQIQDADRDLHRVGPSLIADGR